MLFSCVYGEADRRRPPVTETGTRCRCGSRSSSAMYLLLPVTQIAEFSFRACMAVGVRVVRLDFARQVNMK